MKHMEEKNKHLKDMDMHGKKIAVDMNYSVQHIHRLHGNALRQVKVPK